MARQLPSLLLLLFVGSLGVLVVIDSRYPSVPLAAEIAKAVLQLGVVAVFGTTVSLLVFEYQREKSRIDKEQDLRRQAEEKGRDIERAADERARDLELKRLEYREELLLSTLARAMKAYSQSKRVRRMLRARSVRPGESGKVIVVATYDEYIDVLNDSQLDLENLARDVKTSDLAFSKSELIVTQLWKMEGYLNGLVKEYEEQRPLFPDTATTVPLEDHLRLADFLSSAKSSAFRPEVVDAFHKVQQAIREDLLRPRLPLGSSST